MSAPRVDRDFLVETLRGLLEIPSPSGYTDAIVRFVSAVMQRLGVSFELTRRGAIRANLIGEQSSPDRALVAHLDTIGVMVTGLKPNGRMTLAPIGNWSSRFAEGARVSVFTERGAYRGTILPLKASGHAFGPDIDTAPISWDHVELRADVTAASANELREHGFAVGNYVAVDAGPEFTDAGYIVSRHLDDKAGVAALLTAAKSVVDTRAVLPVDCHLLFTIFEEVGSGASAILHQDVAEMVSVDNAVVAPGQNSDEHAAAVAFMDSAGPFDYHLSHHLLEIAETEQVPVRREVFRHYRSDAATAVEAGNDIRTGLVCFGVDASHGYERTHVDSLTNVATLLAAYMRSGPVCERDRQELGSLAGFPRQPVDGGETPKTKEHIEISPASLEPTP